MRACFYSFSFFIKKEQNKNKDSLNADPSALSSVFIACVKAKKNLHYKNDAFLVSFHVSFKKTHMTQRLLQTLRSSRSFARRTVC